MTNRYIQYHVLSIYLTRRGYAFVLFEGPLSLVDYGVKEIQNLQRNERTLESIEKLIQEYHPEYLVMEDYTETGSRRSARIRRLYRSIIHLARVEQIDIVRYGKNAIRSCFEPEGALTKYEIAKTIAREIPALAHRLPKRRKIWMSEDPRQSLFDAVAQGIVFYAGRGQQM